MRKFLLKGLVFVLLLAIFPVLELFVLPIDYFNFRAWEAITTPYTSFGFNRGFFYPGKNLNRLEHGDIAKWQDPEPIMASWKTDRHGFRNAPEIADLDAYEAVVIGDSNIGGSHLDQAQTLPAVLSELTGQPVYNYGGSETLTRKFFSDPRFAKVKVKNLIVEARPVSLSPQGFYPALFSKLPNGEVVFSDYAFPDERTSNFLLELKDRLYKMNMLQFVRSRLRAMRQPPQWPLEPAPAAQTPGPALPASPDEQLDFAFKCVMLLKEKSEERGTNFIFLLMPNLDRSMDALPGKLRRAGVNVLACVPGDPEFPCPDFGKFYAKHDSHWSPEGVRETAEGLVKLLR